MGMGKPGQREVAVPFGWLDARNSAGNNQAQCFVSASLDGGAASLIA